MNKQQLAAKIWESANRMRSKIEANEYKDYILGFIFYKYLSDKEEQWLYQRDYDADSIREYVNEEAEDQYSSKSSAQQSLGYFIAYKDLFSTWIHMGSVPRNIRMSKAVCGRPSSLQSGLHTSL